MQYHNLKSEFIGLDALFPRYNAVPARRVYLDSAASTLMFQPAWEIQSAFLKNYGNSHSQMHFGARIATKEFKKAQKRILDFFGVDEKQYACIFAGSGSTACLNRISKLLHAKSPSKKTVIVSLLEHHSNDLPHRSVDTLIHAPLVGEGRELGAVHIDHLKELVEQHKDDLRYVAVAHASNVTGVLNPIHEIAAFLKPYNIPLVVDGSQAAPHIPVELKGKESSADIDIYTFSGHKCYVPGSPGVMLLKRSLFDALPASELGGGMVSYVAKENYEAFDDLAEREQAGTPNLPGVVGLGATLDIMNKMNMSTLQHQEELLVQKLWDGLTQITNVHLYGPAPSKAARTGTVVFNIAGEDHGFVAAVLNDFFGIAVRNECFCAHPYVRALIVQDLWSLEFDDEISDEDMQRQVKLKQGMVRISLGMYNTAEDIDLVVNAVRQIAEDPPTFKSHYQVNEASEYELKSAITASQLFDSDAWLAKLSAKS